MNFFDYLVKHVTIAFLGASAASIMQLVVNGQPAGEVKFFIWWLIMIPASMLVNRIKRD